MDVTTDTFEQDVLERSATVPVVVDFWADWCGPCKMLTPVLEQAVEERDGAIVLAKVDTDANPELAERFSVRGIPNVKAFRNGQVVDEFTGALPGAGGRGVPRPADRPAGVGAAPRGADRVGRVPRRSSARSPSATTSGRSSGCSASSRAPIPSGASASARSWSRSSASSAPRTRSRRATGAGWPRPSTNSSWRPSRAPRQDEAQAVTDLVIACDIHELGAPDFELDDLLTDWNMPGLRPGAGRRRGRGGRPARRLRSLHPERLRRRLRAPRRTATTASARSCSTGPSAAAVERIGPGEESGSGRW